MIQRLIEYLKAGGYTPCPNKYSTDIRLNGEFVFNLRDTEEEQPEVLVWCLEELGRRGWNFDLHNDIETEQGSPFNDGRNYELETYAEGRIGIIASGTTMTAAAIGAVC